MKKEYTVRDYVALESVNGRLSPVRKRDGDVRTFKIRRACEGYCMKHGCMLLERVFKGYR